METPLIIHQNIDLKAPFLVAEHNDVARYFSLVPNCPEPLIALVIRQSLADDQHDTNPALLTATLQALLKWRGCFGPLSHLLIATSMLNSDKTVRALAAELWIQGVEEGTLDSERIGQIVGEQARVEFAPLKRFTDLLTERMLRISVKHHQELVKLLSASVALLPEKPVRGQRKLLEIYREVMPRQELDSELVPMSVAS